MFTLWLVSENFYLKKPNYEYVSFNIGNIAFSTAYTNEKILMAGIRTETEVTDEGCHKKREMSVLCSTSGMVWEQFFLTC